MKKNYQNQNCLIEKGSKLIILGLPEGSEFGIDFQGWKVGNKFKGLKMIPPGFHFYYISIQNKYGDAAPRTNYYHYFHEKEILVKKYNPVEESLNNGQEEITTCIKKFYEETEIGLGPFPYECWTKWISLTQHISYHELNRLVSEKVEDNLRYVDASKLDHLNLEKVKEENSRMRIALHTASVSSSCSNSKAEEEFPSVIRSGIKIKYCKFPIKPYKNGATPSEISKGNLDSSYTMSFLLQQLNSPSELLSEVQLSFITFLVGQEWDSWDQWKKLILAFCNAEEMLIEHSNLYFDFLSVFYYQIQEVPEDLFVDIVDSKNFLVIALRTLFANIFDNKMSLPSRLISKAQKFQQHLISKFHWNLDLEDDDEDLPVIVDI